MNITTVERFRQVEEDIAKDKGPFALFALVLRSEASGVGSSSVVAPFLTERWDLVVSAPWLDKSSKSDIDYIVKRIRKRLKTDELRGLSRISILDVSAALVQAFNRDWTIEHGLIRVQGHTICGMRVDEACVITSRAVCRCDALGHSNHRGKHCAQFASRPDGLCEECNQQIAADMKWSPRYSGPEPQGNPRK